MHSYCKGSEEEEKKGIKGGSLKTIVLIPIYYSLQVPTYPPFLRSVMSHTTSQKNAHFSGFVGKNVVNLFQLNLIGIILRAI